LTIKVKAGVLFFLKNAILVTKTEQVLAEALAILMPCGSRRRALGVRADRKRDRHAWFVSAQMSAVTPTGRHYCFHACLRQTTTHRR